MVIVSSRHVIPQQTYFLQTFNNTLQSVSVDASQLAHTLFALRYENEPEDAKGKTKFFEGEDMTSWIIFTVAFFVLIFFDNFVLHRKAEKLSLLQAFLYTCFWVSCAGVFGLYVYYSRGLEDAVTWTTGYILEWMLSIDNLFVFHRIFEVFHTPDEQKHKPLFYGIMGAIVFRMGFFLIGEYMMHHFWWVHIIFGIFLVYTGIKAVEEEEVLTEEEEEKRLKESTIFKFLVKYINYVDKYDENGNFFMPVYINKETHSFVGQPSQGDAPETEVVEVRYRATKLVIVVLCLEITDLLFAVDSVSAIVAQIPDLFLAYTACVFAMLGLRALFFAIDELVKIFSLLCYGVAFILVFLGLKLIFKSYIHIHPVVVCCILLSTLALSIIASIIREKIWPKQELDTPEDTGSGAAKG